ncbi:VTT domain-containing protein [Duganella sp. BuS-21]|uniref:VTT domain-containing protein n=1 Tax=Duganella sp. BuS-21 TaxID=2943848 RepID=UPI0035A69677
MEQLLATFIAWFLHLDVHLVELIELHGNWVYLILFLVIFIETGVIVMPFLPGDSLLFIAGALAAKGLLDPLTLCVLLFIAAVAGDSLNFSIGAWFRRKALDTSKIPFVKAEHLQHTHDFFTKHGGKTIILARFVPIVRTFAPFVAALGAMPRRVFLTYNVTGAFLWIGSLIAAGYLFGNIPWVSRNLTAVVMGIVVISILPALAGWLRSRRLA